MQRSGKNVELMWLLGRLAPDFKTIAVFRKNNGEAIRLVHREFVMLCRKLNLFSDDFVAIDGSKFRAVNNRNRNFSKTKIKARLQQIDDSIARYLGEIASADRREGEVWARCYAQTDTDGYLEQLLRYEDRYELHEGRWRFLHRRHRLWFGVASQPSPLAQPEARWPEHQVGVGDIPFDNPAFVRWWDELDQ